MDCAGLGDCGSLNPQESSLCAAPGLKGTLSPKLHNHLPLAPTLPGLKSSLYSCLGCPAVPAHSWHLANTYGSLLAPGCVLPGSLRAPALCKLTVHSELTRCTLVRLSPRCHTWPCFPPCLSMALHGEGRCNRCGQCAHTCLASTPELLCSAHTLPHAPTAGTRASPTGKPLTIL